MLIEFFGRNFCSFRDEFHLSMIATDIDPGDERGVVPVQLEHEDEPLRLLRCAAIYGPNASGKSNVLRAANALEFLLTNSAGLASDAPIPPYEPFLLDNDSREEPVMLGLRAVVGGLAYEYSIEFERTRFVRETLAELRPNDERVLFARHEQSVNGLWTEDRQFELLVKSFRPNALLLSLADRLAPSLAGGIAVAFRRLLGYYDPTRTHPLLGFANSAQIAAEDKAGFGNWLIDWLRCADIGIVDYEAERMPDKPHRDDENLADTLPGIEFRLSLFHAGTHDSVEMSYMRESMGTRKMVELAPFLYELISGDEIRSYFIDEIGASIHPHMLETLVQHFNCEVAPETVRGQLIFATHETTLLDAEAKNATLRRDQVYFTEKDEFGVSRLYSLAEFKERNNLNLRKRYLHGRYGALPAIGSLGG